MLKDISNRFFNNIKKLIIGEASKPLHGIAILCVTIFFAGACLVAQSYFPTPYSIFLDTISSQGNLILNPDGQWFFNAGVFVTGWLLIPHFLYLNRRYAPTTGILALLTTAAGIAGAVGLSLLGIYPSGGPCCHNFAAAAAFNGCGIVGLLSLIIVLVKIIKRDNAPRVGWVLVFYGIIAAYAIFIGFINEMSPIISFLHLDPRVKNFAFREWSMLFIEVFWLIGSYAILPDKQILPVSEIVKLQVQKLGRHRTYFHIGFQVGACAYIFLAILFPSETWPIVLIPPSALGISLPYINVGLWESMLFYGALFVIVDWALTHIKHSSSRDGPEQQEKRD